MTDEQQLLYDSYDVYTLVDILIELDIISKEVLIEDYWYDIKENLGEISVFQQE